MGEHKEIRSLYKKKIRSLYERLLQRKVDLYYKEIGVRCPAGVTLGDVAPNKRCQPAWAPRSKSAACRFLRRFESGKEDPTTQAGLDGSTRKTVGLGRAGLPSKQDN